MHWRIEFHDEREGILARYRVEAPTPVTAVRLGRDAPHLEYPPKPARRRLSGYAQARRIGGQDGAWVLYRIVREPDTSGPTVTT